MCDINVTVDTDEQNPMRARPLKGKSRLQDVDDYVVIDIETTGLDPRYDEIIEIGALRVASGVIKEEFQSLCKPGREIDDFITELTGITNEMLADAPDLSCVLAQFLDVIGDSILVGHNINFDINFLYDFYLEELGVPLTNDYIDTLRLSRRILKELPNRKLKTLVNFFSLSVPSYHRGLADCIATQMCYEELKKYCVANHVDLQEAVYGYSQVRAKDVIATTSDFDPSNPLYQMVCVFTGKLERLTRREAMQVIVNHGGICGDTVTKKTNYLILGNFDYCLSVKEGKSGKQKKAEKYILEGRDLKIISENVFYEMLGGLPC